MSSVTFLTPGAGRKSNLSAGMFRTSAIRPSRSPRQPSRVSSSELLNSITVRSDELPHAVGDGAVRRAEAAARPAALARFKVRALKNVIVRSLWAAHCAQVQNNLNTAADLGYICETV